MIIVQCCVRFSSFTPVFLPEESPWTEEPGGLQSMGLQKSDRTEQLSVVLVSGVQYIYTYTHVYVCICTHIHTYVYIHIYTYVYIHIYICTHIHTYVYIHIYTCVYIPIYIYPAFFRFFSQIGHCRVLSRFPAYYSRSLLVIYFIHSSVYMGLPRWH